MPVYKESLLELELRVASLLPGIKISLPGSGGISGRKSVISELPDLVSDFNSVWSFSSLPPSLKEEPLQSPAESHQLTVMERRFG